MGRGQPRPWWGWVGVGLLAGGLWILAVDLPVWNVSWYLFAWYGYLLLLDATLHRLQGHSFLSHRRRELGAMLFWSIPFWFLFEAYNLVLHNWYYVFVLHDDRLQEVIGWLAFATVLPACFFHAEILAAKRAFATWSWRPRSLGPGGELALVFLGAASVIAPLLWPRWAFPLVWGATLWWPALYNRRAGAPSLLADLERGDPRRLLRLLAGGLLAGAVWEALNHWARCKWIYTVPGFDDWKVFEMPVAGFLGFPVLAVAAFEGYSCLCRLVRGGRWWEETAGREELHAFSPGRQAVWLTGAALALLFNHGVFRQVVSDTVRSRRPLLSELEALRPGDVRALEGTGIATPERLLRAVDRAGPRGVATQSGLEPHRVETAVEHAELALHKGMGAARASLLRRHGIGQVADLAQADPEQLWRGLVAGSIGRPPSPGEVQVWVRAARRGDGPRR